MDKYLQRFDLLLKNLFYKSIEHYKLIVYSTAIFFLFFSYQCLHLKQISSIEDQLDPKMQSTKDLKFEKEEFGASNSLGFIVPKSLHHHNPNYICQFQNNFNNLIYENNLIEKVNSPFKIRQAKLNQNILTYERVLSNPCETNQFSLINLKDTFYQGSLTSNELDDLLYSFSLRPMENPGPYMYFNYDYIKNIKNKFESSLSKDIIWFGADIQQFYTIEGMAHSQWINLALIIIIWLMLRLYFGTFLSGFIFISTLFFTNGIIYGGMSLFNQPVDPLSICLFLMLAVSSLQDFVFVAKHQLDHNENFIESHLALITPSFFTTLTTFLGFGSLMISDLQSIRRFGFWAMTGSMIEWIAVFLIIPSFMQMFPKLQLWVKKDKSISLNFLGKLFQKSPNPLISKFSLIIFILALFSMKHFRLSQTPTEMFPKNHPFQSMIDYVQKNRGWEGEVHLIFKPELTKLEKETIIKKISSNEIIQKLESKQNALDFLGAKITDKSFIDLIQHDFKISGLGDRYTSETNFERAFLYLKTSNTEKINNLRNQVERICPTRECFITGSYVGFADYSFQLIKTLFDSFFLSLFLVMLVILFLVKAHGSKKYFKLIVSSFWGPAVMLCLIYAFDLSINFVTCVVASTLVGLTGDNAIQFLFASKDSNLNNGIDTRSMPAFYCTITMSFVSLLFLFSYFEAPRTLGILLALGFLFSFVGDVWILKGLDSD